MRLWLTIAVLTVLALAMLALAGAGAAGKTGDPAPTRVPHATMSGEFDQRPLAVLCLPGVLRS